MSTLFAAENFDSGASGPLYLQLQRHIAQALTLGDLVPGDCLPAERDMVDVEEHRHPLTEEPTAPSMM